jgi:hypothetical protein
MSKDKENFPLKNSNEIKSFAFSPLVDKDDKTGLLTFGYEVKNNSLNFRSPEFKKNIDLLFAGCSFTWGSGLPFDVTWGVKLAKENNLSYNSIAFPGGSCMRIVFNIFKYFENFGNPKTLLVLFPDFSRVRTYVDSKILVSENKEEYFKFIDHQYPKHKYNIPKYIQLPTDAKNLYSEEFCYMLNSMYIKMLEVYCNNNNIKFIWFKWTEDFFDLDGGLSGFSNYYPVNKNDLKGWELNASAPIHSMCHQEEKNTTGQIDYLWHMAKDAQHFGIHWHIHVKEIFQKAMKEI